MKNVSSTAKDIDKLAGRMLAILTEVFGMNGDLDGSLCQIDLNYVICNHCNVDTVGNYAELRGRSIITELASMPKFFCLPSVTTLQTVTPSVSATAD